jgi:omega-6 fatty acid desaturase (delta-12 desaturase)
MSAAHRRKRPFRGLALFACDAAAYLLLLAGACLLPTWWLKGLCALAAGLSVGRLFGLAHDAAHGTLTPWPRLNRWVARLAFCPALTPLEGWALDHHARHHAHLRVRGKDTTWPPLSLQEYRARPPWGRLWYRFLRTPPGVGFYWVFEYWLPYLFWPARADLGRRRAAFRADRLLVCAFVVALWLALCGLGRAAAGLGWAEPAGPAGVLALAVAAPFWVWATVSGMIDFVTHTHPRAVWFAGRSEWSYRDNVRNTPHVVFPLGMNALFHNFFEHTAHHADPRIPLYHLPGAQAELEAAFGAELAVERFGPGYFLRLLRLCRLYDFERHRWLDYDGRATTEPQPLAAATPGPARTPPSSGASWSG